MGEDGETTAYIEAKNSARINGGKGEAYIDLVTKPDEDTVGENETLRLSPKRFQWSDNIGEVTFDVPRMIMRGLALADATPTLAFFQGKPDPVPTTPTVALKATSTTDLAFVGNMLQPNTDNQTDLGTDSKRWKTVYTQLLNVKKDATVQGNINVTGNAAIAGNLSAGAITAPLAGTSTKGVISVSIGGSGKFIVDASISNGVLTLTRGSATVAELVSMLKAAGVSCSTIVSTFGCTCSTAGCSCSSQGCYSNCTAARNSKCCRRTSAM
jgi:hypothetical protein